MKIFLGFLKGFLVFLFFFVVTLCLNSQIQGTCVKENFLTDITLNQKDLEKDFLYSSCCMLKDWSTTFYQSDSSTCLMTKQLDSLLISFYSVANKKNLFAYLRGLAPIIISSDNLLRVVNNIIKCTEYSSSRMCNCKRTYNNNIFKFDCNSFFKELISLPDNKLLLPFNDYN